MLGRKLSKAWCRRLWPCSTPSPTSALNAIFIKPMSGIEPTGCPRYIRQMSTNAHIPPHLITPRWVDPHVHQDSSNWQRMSHRTPGLEPGSVVKLVSWNLNWSNPDTEARTSAGLTHLEHVFNQEDDNLVIMFQEICPLALRIVLKSQWVQRKFILSDVIPPATARAVSLNSLSVLQESSRVMAPYFTIMMIAKEFPVLGCFRIPLVTSMGRDVLAIGVPISDNKSEIGDKGCIIFCTTHLESLPRGKSYRLGQLAVIANLLNQPTISDYNVLGGIVGGDMNSIDKSEHSYHKKDEVNLNDVWEDQRLDLFPGKGLSDDCGSTWGYQPPQHRHPVRLDKFLYTGAIEPVPVADSPYTGRRIELFGVGLKTEVEAWELEREDVEFHGGELHTRQHRELISKERLITLNNLGFLKSYAVKQKKMDAWVSDHFGIITKIRILSS